MKHSILGATIAALCVGAFALADAAHAAKMPESREFVRADGVTVKMGAEWVSPAEMPSFRTVDIRTLPGVPGWKPGDPLVEIPRQLWDGHLQTPTPVNPVFGEDPLARLQREYDRSRSGETRAFNTPIQNFNGIRTTASPNDPTGDVGTLQFVMSINGSGGSQVAVYDKATGTQIGSNFSMASLGSGGACGNNGAGDPIVLFDQLANRWVLTEFSSQATRNLCVYLSNTDDLSGPVTWTRYNFVLPAFPDYPKYGVWPDAYYVGANESGTAGARPFYAMDRVRMLAGEPATLQRLTVPRLTGFSFQMVQPAHISGSNLPSAGAPGIFMRHRDDEAHNAGSNNPNADFLEMFEFTVDWNTPANSNIAGPVNIQISEFSSDLNGLTAFTAFPQPSGQLLDPLRETVMHRLIYRRFDTYEALVGNLVTDLFLGPGSTYPNDTGAVRWFELRRPLGPLDDLFADGFEGGAEQPAGGGPAQWTLHQEGTFAPEDAPGVPANQADRWMAAINIDDAGNIALAYNVVRQTPAISASLRYTGRLRDDPLGVMTQGETVIVTGNGNTTNERWGDYNDMGVDPVDGCTFWFVGNYADQALVGAGARANRIVAFKHDACGTPGFTLGAAVSSASVCANSGSTTNASPLTVNVGSVSGFNNTVNLAFGTLPAGISASVVPNSVSPPGSTQVTLGANNTAATGANLVTLNGTASGAPNRSLEFTLNVATAAPGAPTLVAPANGATGVSTNPVFSWNPIAGATGYIVEASTSSDFSTLLFSQAVSGTSLNSPVGMPAGGQVFWRVRASNICGNGGNSSTFSFTTANEYCRTPNLAIPDGNVTGVFDEITVAGFVGNVSNLKVAVDIDHTWVADLRLRLTRVSDNTQINLMTNPTNNPTGSCSGDNVRVVYDDGASIPAQTGCISGAVPTMEGPRIPQQPLSTFNGQTLNGTWRLTVIDSVNLDTGSLLRWCLQ